jgi:TonB family protein
MPSQVPLTSQQVAAPVPVPPIMSYPESESGLDHLGKDMLKALKDGNAERAMALAQSMVLPDPAGWYHLTFGDYSGSKEIASYTNERAQLPLAILGFFKNAIRSGNNGVRVKRFGASCDDNDGENTFPTLDARVSSTALYDLRLYNGDKYLRLWPIAYVDGTFRFVAESHPWDYFPRRPQAESPSAAATNTNAEKTGARVLQGGNVVAAKLLNRVKPEYPDVARGEHLQGIVRLHAIIAKDGTIEQLRVIKGYCSLARPSLDAVKKWRYSPTTIMGQPVEVDTTIDVIFFLNPR